jgi:hypothetical protein
MEDDLPTSVACSEQVVYPPANTALRPIENKVAFIPSNQISSQLDVLRALASGAQVERIQPTDASFPSGGYRIRGNVSLMTTPESAPEGLKGQAMKPRRIGVYWSWLADMDEGWLRFFFDSMGIPHQILRPADVRSGKALSKIDVLVFGSVRGASLRSGPTDRRLPDEYKGGLGDEGLEAIRKFVLGGGTLITLNESSDLSVGLFDLPLTRLGRQSGRGGGERGGGAPDRTNVNTPGSALMMDLVATHPLNFGVSGPRAAFINNSDTRAFGRSDSNNAQKIHFAATLREESMLGAGFGEGLEQLAGGGTVVHAPIGKGHAVLFTFSPHFRCQTWSTFPLFLNALLLGSTMEKQ